MKWLLLLSAYLTLSANLHAEPFPQEALVDFEYWKIDEFKSQFRPTQAGSKISHRAWPEATEFFGVKPHKILAKFEDDEIESITMLFLDSGTHFGYIPRSQAVANEKANRDAFRKLYSETRDKVAEGLKTIATSDIKTQTIGVERMLKQQIYLLKTSDKVTARMHSVEEQLIKVTLFPASAEAHSWIAEADLEMRRRDREAKYAQRVNQLSNGDVLLNDIPLMPQGDRAYCGISALAMVMQYVDLDIETEDYAAAAGIRYGSTRGSKIRETYSAAADEAGFRMSRTTRFDFNRTKRCIDEGLPVLVWRKWSQERDFVHTAFSKRFRKDPNAKLPEPDSADRETWPGKNAYSHATVITGYNMERKEIIFTESWTERERNRRMRIEELEGTAYYTFFLSL